MRGTPIGADLRARRPQGPGHQRGPGHPQVDAPTIRRSGLPRPCTV